MSYLTAWLEHDMTRPDTITMSLRELDRSNVLVQSIKVGKYGETLETCDKLRALELSAKLQGLLIDRAEIKVKQQPKPEDIAAAVQSTLARRGLVPGQS